MNSSVRTLGGGPSTCGFALLPEIKKVIGEKCRGRLYGLLCENETGKPTYFLESQWWGARPYMLALLKVPLLFLFEYYGFLVISFSLLFPTGFIHSLRISWFSKCVMCHGALGKRHQVTLVPTGDTHSTIQE